MIYARRLSSGLIPCFNINQYICLLKPDAASCVFSVSTLTTESIRRGLIVSRREVNFLFQFCNGILLSSPASAPSKAWVCGSSFAGFVGSNPAGGHGSFSPVSVTCCQVDLMFI